MTVIAFSPSQPDGASPSDLRRELADAIADRQAAENAARSAKAVFERAKAALIEATGEVQRLTADLSAKRDAVIREDAVRLTRAHREGREPPPALPALDHGSPALDAAQARLKACEMAAAELQAEYLKANEAAIRAAAKVRAIVDDILDSEAQAKAQGLVECAARLDRLTDEFNGLMTLDLARPHLRLTHLKNQIEMAADRRKQAIAKDGRMIELHAWNAHLATLIDAERDRWRDYRGRLMESADATFEPTPTDQGAAA